MFTTSPTRVIQLSPWNCQYPGNVPLGKGTATVIVLLVVNEAKLITLGQAKGELERRVLYCVEMDVVSCCGWMPTPGSALGVPAKVNVASHESHAEATTVMLTVISLVEVLMVEELICTDKIAGIGDVVGVTVKEEEGEATVPTVKNTVSAFRQLTFRGFHVPEGKLRNMTADPTNPTLVDVTLPFSSGLMEKLTI